MAARTVPGGAASSEGRVEAVLFDIEGDDRIEAVVFDIGGVVSGPWAPVIVRSCEAAGIDRSALIASLLPLFSGGLDGDAPAHRLERGEITLEQFFASLGEAEPVARAIVDPLSPHFALDRFEPHDGVVGLAREIASSGRRLGVLTNDAAEWRPAFQPLIDAIGPVDVLVRSSEAGVRKPNAAAYRLVIERLGVEASRVLYLDDFEPMVAAAAAVGMRTLHVVDHDTAIGEARSLLGL